MRGVSQRNCSETDYKYFNPLCGSRSRRPREGLFCAESIPGEIFEMRDDLITQARPAGVDTACS